MHPGTIAPHRRASKITKNASSVTASFPLLHLPLLHKRKTARRSGFLEICLTLSESTTRIARHGCSSRPRSRSGGCYRGQCRLGHYWHPFSSSSHIHGIITAVEMPT